MDVDPNDDAVVQNYEDFLDNRLPGGLFAGGGPGEIVRKRGIVLQQASAHLATY